VRFSRSQDPVKDLRNKIRQVYDLHQILQDDKILRFFEGREFDEMMVKVGDDDRIGYKNIISPPPYYHRMKISSFLHNLH
jgi:hypothetical protein